MNVITGNNEYKSIPLSWENPSRGALWPASEGADHAAGTSLAAGLRDGGPDSTALLKHPLPSPISR